MIFNIGMKTLLLLAPVAGDDVIRFSGEKSA
jgi:hypothetical protein